MNIHGQEITREQVIEAWEASGRNISRTYNHFGIKNGEETYKGFIKEIVWAVEASERPNEASGDIFGKRMLKGFNHLEKVTIKRKG